MSLKKLHILAELQSDILRMQGFKPAGMLASNGGLDFMRSAFPNGSFPTGCIHEFLAAQLEDIAATSGFMSGILSSLTKNSGAVLWVSTMRKIFPPALKNFGIEPDRFIFIDLQKEKDVLWAMEEALKCSALTAVVGEIQGIDFTSSRRLQLAVEESKVTGFVLRTNVNKLSTTACVSRWKVASLPSLPIDDLPGIGFPSWRVELLRMRNGRTGAWSVQWINREFVQIQEHALTDNVKQMKVG
jgi:protein ImuA